MLYGPDGKTPVTDDIEARLTALGADKEAVVYFILATWPDAANLSGQELDDLAMRTILDLHGAMPKAEVLQEDDDEDET